MDKHNSFMDTLIHEFRGIFDYLWISLISLYIYIANSVNLFVRFTDVCLFHSSGCKFVRGHLTA